MPFTVRALVTLFQPHCCLLLICPVSKVANFYKIEPLTRPVLMQTAMTVRHIEITIKKQISYVEKLQHFTKRNVAYLPAKYDTRKCAFRSFLPTRNLPFSEPFPVDCRLVSFQWVRRKCQIPALLFRKACPRSTESCNHVSMNVACFHPGVWGDQPRRWLRMTAWDDEGKYACGKK